MGCGMVLDTESYETMRNNWLDARLLPPEGNPSRRKNDGHHFNLGMFDDIYRLGYEAAEAKVERLETGITTFMYEWSRLSDEGGAEHEVGDAVEMLRRSTLGEPTELEQRILGDTVPTPEVKYDNRD